MAAVPCSLKFRVFTAFNAKFKAGIQPRRWETSMAAVPSSCTFRVFTACSAQTSTSSSCSYTAAVLIIGFGTRLADSNKEREGQEI